MRVLRGIAAADPRGFRAPIATIGVFDGVHLGHQHLLAALAEWSDGTGGGDRVVITFDSHPQEVLGQRPPVYLTTLEHRLALLGRHGASATLVLTFDRELATWSPERFIREVVVGAIGSRRLLLGFDSTFGAGARGNAEYLRRHPEIGVEVRESDPYRVDGEVVSSTAIRQAVLKGELERAARGLGRPVSLWGRVMHGDGRGRGLGFPTANLNLMHAAAPPHGVYLARLELDDRPWPALVNIGRRPTFMRPDDPVDYSRYFNEQLDRVEVYIHGYEGDLYDRAVEVELHDKLRDERRFPDQGALIAQIRRDVESLGTWWRGRGTASR
jgi:riboflavin kinase/FMN adenylyltransferase